MPDPLLQGAMSEIQAILVKHDIAGIVTLASRTHLERLWHITPSWSCVWMEGDTLLRIRSRREDYPDKAAQKEELEHTIGMMMGFMDVAHHMIEQLTPLMERIGLLLEINHHTTSEPPAPPTP